MTRNEQGLVLLTILGAVLLAVFGGCSRRDARQSVSGTVTLDGSPMAGAIITFQPEKGGVGNSSGTTVAEDGRFSIPAARGLVPGKYLVAVQLWKDTNETFIDENGKLAKARTTIRYQEAGELVATVVAGGDNQFGFRLTSMR